ncbi:DsrH/TusB family sulfur metabolism protein [Methyloglobulus sp.]|uniref:DsrH/TusB family sulfur relay protein n=1 Tax=Methyloglobulus sp. TaxID=2518622 RepID=UPI0032B7BFDC
MLHLVFQSPIDIAVLERMDSGDVAVFLESAVLGVLQKGRLADVLATKVGSNRLCVLSEDMVIRGILVSELVAGLEVIDYSGFVNLAVENQLIQSWC